MANQLGGWRLLVHFFLPIPLILTILLVIPLPKNARKGILMFTHRTLSFTMIGGMKLVHFSLLASGIPLVDSVFRTMKSSQAADGREIRPELKIGLLAKKWREERNFWIAAMGFTLWCLLSVLFAQVSHMVKLEDELEELQDEVCDLKGLPRPARPTQRVKDLANAKVKEVTGAARRAAGSANAAAQKVARSANAKITEAQAAAAGFATSVRDQVEDKVRGARRGPGSPGVRDASPMTRGRAKATTKDA